MTNGYSRSRRQARRIALALLLAGSAAPAWTATATADAAAVSSGSQAAPDQHQDIVVTAPSLFPDLRPERSLDQTAIESYGESTVDELLGDLQGDLGDDEQPLILVNGERVSDPDEIGALPVEVLRTVQVLPRGSAVRLGGTPGQRVISLVLHKEHRSATLTVAPKVATEGDWHAVRGEAILTRIHGNTRINLALRARDETSLLESQRGIVQPEPTLPYAAAGNVIAYPDLSGEIDPILTDAAGEVVTVAPIPAAANPGLGGFAAGANQAAVTDLGRFRTLRPTVRNYDLNGSVSTHLTRAFTGSATVHLTRNDSGSLRGLPTGLFVLPADSAYSPFSRDVALASYGASPLHSRFLLDAGEGNVTVNGHFGSWTGTFNGRHTESTEVFRNGQQASFGPILLGDNVDPFGGGLANLMAIESNRTRTHSTATSSQLSMTGPAVKLPAGDVIATVEGRLAWNHLRSTSTFDFGGNTDFRRSEQGFRGALDIPLTSRANRFVPQIGDLRATVDYSRVHYSDAGTLNHRAFGLIWEPVPALRLSGQIERTETPASIQLLGQPAVETPDVRIFDPLTGETVDVVAITGGSPSLRPETDRIGRVTALLRLVPKLNLELNGEYTDTDRRGFISSLPDQSAAIMLAFPDRFIRDSNGVLTTVDLRPVNFDSDHEKRLRWGLSMNARIGGGRPGAPVPAGSPQARVTPTTFLQLTANHSMVFSDTIVIRPGLAPIDLLGGGAIGIGGARLRHQLDGTAAVTSGGLGVRVGATWRGPTSLNTRIDGVADTLRFSPVLLLNLRAFADASRFVPASHWAKGLRLSMDVLNLANDRQKVRDSLGNTPLQYQPAYRDPLGRTIEFEIRKVF